MRTVPSSWKRGATILIYKKGATDDPSNFRPITLQPVWHKVFTSVYTSKMYQFLNENHHLYPDTQKGFMKGVDGVIEHTELLSHILRVAERTA